MKRVAPLVSVVPATRTEEVPRLDPDEPVVGRWYWVKRSDFDVERDGEGSDLGCIVRLGSNFAELSFPGEGTVRVHADDFVERCTFEPDPEAVIHREVSARQMNVAGMMEKVRELTARLAITPGAALGDGSETSALAVRRGDGDLKKYKRDLVRAKDKTLPELFAGIAKENEALALWLSASLIPLKAQADGMRPAITAINRRIFNVELYAGLVENVVQVREGEPAPLTEKLRIYQRRAYMDEECLAHYKTGGMDFKDIRAFDRWLSRSEHLNRLLPFPRCLVAFRVRRNEKRREWENLRELVRVIEDGEADKLTFLYIRNGEQLFRLNTEIEFDEKLFPDMQKTGLTTKLWARRHATRASDIISDDEYQAMRQEDDAKARANRALPKEERDVFLRHRVQDYEPFDPSNVHYDDISDMLKSEIEKHNRLVLVLQGLLDRSPVLHPHPPWQIWTAAGFSQAIELVYDDTRALTAGDKPDFEAYRRTLNASLAPDCVTVGQEYFWLRAEGEKECARMDRDYRSRSREWRPETYKPPGNPGPGLLAHPTRVTRKGACTFDWNRERVRATYSRWGHEAKDPEIGCSITVPADKLLNASAYKPGDFKKFFADPRTRADYLQWAPLLLVCEEFVAGNLKPRGPVQKKKAERSGVGRVAYYRRKRRLALVGKAVRLVEQITMRSGKVYAAETLWRVIGVVRGGVQLTGITPDGLVESNPGKRYVSGVDPSELRVDDSIPATPNKEKTRDGLSDE